MINKNEGLIFIRCNKYEYLVKKGSLSNYSYNIIDESKDGFLDYLFEKSSFPIEKSELIKQMIAKLELSSEIVEEYIERLITLKILEDKTVKPLQQNVVIICNKEIERDITTYFCNLNMHFNITGKYTLDNLDISNLDLNQTDLVICFTSYFSPQLFYKINKKFVENNQPFLISYLDGNEGIVLPLLNPQKKGCYNDFELLRESSFYNLLDYQVMKEKLIENQQAASLMTYSSICLASLLLNTLLITNYCLSKGSINNFAYSFDFERMVNTKIKLLKFPNCPSCQGDGNITHPFI
ncbi:hypothetical protein [Candidatus Enterococcus courvalinii]|uniref:Bacteriocin biosynthesis cyclodehydratase n=1 Tax=Candidatus Enterococcus courvalinii TaxID=2815329 RepID=A0ABS3HXW6_9ENTE|nr:hypothetical protein [Enterococcus sp. MSG2901]MBO0481266.1 hypothetical protein [Enterococcus sp. MSG2901]